MGWAFTATSNISVTALGLYDGGGDGLADAHEIGLWTNSGTLLTTLTIPEGTGATLIGGTRFVNITPLALQANETYVIGAFYRGQPGMGYGAIDSDSDRDGFVLQTGVGSIIYTPGINFAGARTSSQQMSGMAFPNFTSAPFQAFLGPNFLFEAQPTAPVPEPATMLLFGTGLAVVAAKLRRRSNHGDDKD